MKKIKYWDGKNLNGWEMLQKKIDFNKDSNF